MSERIDKSQIQVTKSPLCNSITLSTPTLTLTTMNVLPSDNHLRFYGAKQSNMITYHNVEEYKEHSCIPRDYIPNPDDMIFEAGAGLGAFIPYVVQRLHNRLKHRPVVVDPLNYNLVISLLERFIDEKMNPENIPLAFDLIERARIYLDLSCVNLINLPFMEALDHPEFQKKYDLVIDYYGPWLYSPFSMKVSEIEQSLRK